MTPPPKRIVSDVPRYSRSELVIGLVYPTGTNSDLILGLLSGHLSKFGYSINEIRLSEELSSNGKYFGLKTRMVASPPYQRTNSLMNAGNDFRELYDSGDAVARLGVLAINMQRPGAEQKVSLPIERVAHIIRSIRRPEEVRLLREIYGPGFVLIGVYSSEEECQSHLIEDVGMSKSQANQLLERDRGEPGDFGQKTSEAFHLADVFVNSRKPEELTRFIDLLFGRPFLTPTFDEHHMFIAYSAALRSADLSRQVGAAVVSSSGELIATGANDVPRFGGGQYWPGGDDRRDWTPDWGGDSNTRRREDIIKETIFRLFGKMSKDAFEKKRGLLDGCQIEDITEYGRAVHAEMEALVSCGRKGVSPAGGMLFSTTFPCHNCAKHIVAAGIERVVYIEPYPKSKALDLHRDAISEKPGAQNKVQFEHFIGVGPRRYFDLFSLVLGSGYAVKRKSGMEKVEWRRSRALPRLALSPYTYLEWEENAVYHLGLGGMTS